MIPDAGPSPGAPAWLLADRLIDEGRSEDWLARRNLGALVAHRRHQRELPLGDAARREARRAVANQLTAEALLARVRDRAEGRLLVLKGPELGRCHPDEGLRPFADLDVLSDQSSALHKALLADGFRASSDHPRYRSHHHLAPLTTPALVLPVEVHRAVGWPSWAIDPTPDLLHDALPSRTALPGVERPADHHHAVLVAVHAWRNRPYGELRDLVDIAALVGPDGPDSAASAAAHWGVGRIWHTMWRAVESEVLCGRSRPLGPRLLARHLWAAEVEPAPPARRDLVVGAATVIPLRAVGRRLLRSVLRADEPEVGELPEERNDIGTDVVRGPS